MSVVFLPENIELEETGDTDEIYDDIEDNPAFQEQGEAVYENVDNPPSQQQQPPETLQFGKILKLFNDITSSMMELID